MFKNILKTKIAVLLGVSVFAASCGEETTDNTGLMAALLLAPAADTGLCAAPKYNWSGTQDLTAAMYVQEGECLKIAAGTTIKGANGTYIFVLPGAAIEAVGTAEKPIVFTSNKAEGSRASGDWGGLVLIGNGARAGTGTGTTEGDQPQNYPGTKNVSVNMQYVRVEFAGSVVGEGDELNGISLYTVAQESGSKFENIQVHMGLDDGIEWFGGDLNGSNLIVTGADDDSFDLDDGFTGTLTNLIAEQYPDTAQTASSSPHGLEWDGTTESGSSLVSRPNVSAFTIIGANRTGSDGARWREGLDMSLISNGVIFGFADGVAVQDDGKGCPIGTPANIASDKAAKLATATETCTIPNVTVDATLAVTAKASAVNYVNTDVDYTLTKAADTTATGADWSKFSNAWMNFKFN